MWIWWRLDHQALRSTEVDVSLEDFCEHLRRTHQHFEVVVNEKDEPCIVWVEFADRDGTDTASTNIISWR